MYCYRHVICNFSYYMYSRMCNPTEQVSHFDSVDRQKGKHYPIKNYSGVSVEFRQIKAAMGPPKQQMLPSFWSDNSTAISGHFKHPIVCDFPAGLASEFSRESPLKNRGCFIVANASMGADNFSNRCSYFLNTRSNMLTSHP